MPRFRSSLWDVHGFIQESWLDRISDTQLGRELNNERSFSFSIPINDVVYPLLQTRKIVRLHDTDKNIPNGYVTSTTNDTEFNEKRFTSSSVENISVGDYLQIYERPPNFLASKTSTSITAGVGKSIDLSGYSGTLPDAGQFVKIYEDIGTQKFHSNGVPYSSCNAEVVEVLSRFSTTITVDLAYSYEKGAIVSSPARSFVARVIGVDGAAVYLNRMDFKITADSRFYGVDFETFRINEITENRAEGVPTANISCRHITFDLNDILFFKDARMDISYSGGGAGLKPDNKVTPSALLDELLARHTKKDGNPATTKSFIKGDLVDFYYSKGGINGTSGGSTVTGTDLADFASQKFSPGSKIYIKGESTPRIIERQSGGNLYLNSNLTSSVSAGNYLIISQGIYDALTPSLGTAQVTYNQGHATDMKRLTSVAGMVINDGSVTRGAIIRFEQYPDEEYRVTWVDNGTTIHIDRDHPFETSSTVKIMVEPDEREVNVSSMETSLGVLNNLISVFNDDVQFPYYWVTEDRAIHLYSRIEKDDRDPTSDLVVMYRNDQNRNLRSINREFDYSSFGNRIIPQGASSGWSNVSSGIKVGVSDRKISNNINATTVAFNNATNTLTDSSLDQNFEQLGVLPGMRVSRTHTSTTTPFETITRFSYITSVGTGASGDEVVLQDEIEILGDSGVWALNDIYEIDFGVTNEQFKIADSSFNNRFRLGDPVLIHKSRQQVVIGDAGQVTVTKGVSGVATGGLSNRLIDTVNDQFTGDVQPKCLMRSTTKGNKDTHLVTAVTTAEQLEFIPDLSPSSSAFASGDGYVISTTRQLVKHYDAGYTDITANTFRGGNGAPGSDYLGSSSDELLFGSNEKFDYVQYTLTTASSGTAAYTWKYWDGNSWEDLTLLDTGGQAFNNTINLEYNVTWEPPRTWAKQTLDGDNAYYVKVIVDSTVTTSPKINDVKLYGWKKNQYRGGMLYIENGKAKGQTRNIISNDMDTLVIGSRFPNLSDIKGSTAIVSEKVGQTQVKGFGYKVLSVDSATSTTVKFNTLLPAYVYYNGLLTVKSGQGQSQVFRIANNIVDTDYKSKFTIDGVFNPIPNGQIEIYAHPQMLHSQDSGLVTASNGPNATVSGFDGVNWATNQWLGAKAIITDDSSNGYYQIQQVITNDSNSIQLMTGWANQPTGNVGCMLVKPHALPMSVVSGLDFTPNHNDEISLSLKMGGGPLTVGKSVNYRTFSTYSVRDIANVEDSSFFSKGDIIFVGANEVPTDDFYNVNRGDQVLGQAYTIKKVVNVTGVLTSSTTDDDINDSTKNFINLGVTAGMVVKNVNTSSYAMVESVTATRLTTTGGVTFEASTPHSYEIQSLVLEDDFDTVPQFGDHVELIGITDGASARKNDLIEVKFQESKTTDPTVLYREAKKKLQKLKDIEPRYTVSFVDLYELDPERYPFDNYVLGDTIKIIDEDITGPDGYNLRIIKESFDPSLPEDKTHTLEVGKRKRSFIRDDYMPLNLSVSDANDKIEELKLSLESPVCAFFDSQTNRCAKPTPPNSFCDSSQSNNDGKLTRRKTPITRYHCQSYTPVSNSQQAGTDNPLNESFVVQAKRIQQNTFQDTRTYAVNVPFVLDKKKSKAIIVNVEDVSTLSAAIPGSVLIVEFKTDTNGDIIPYNPYNSEFGYGGYVRVRKSASDPTIYNADILVTAVGRYTA